MVERQGNLSVSAQAYAMVGKLIGHPEVDFALVLKAMEDGIASCDAPEATESAKRLLAKLVELQIMADEEKDKMDALEAADTVSGMAEEDL